jgi:hypothetical protein
MKGLSLLRTGEFATNFIGTNERINFGNDASISREITDAFSAFIWVKANRSLAVTSEIIMNKYDAVTSRGWFFYSSGATPTKITLFLRNQSTKYIQVEADTPVFDDDDWHLVGYTYTGNGLASGVQMYVDGVVSAKTVLRDNIAGSSILTSEQFAIGSFTNDTNYFKGVMKTASFWSKALSAGEVTTIHSEDKNYPD